MWYNESTVVPAHTQDVSQAGGTCPPVAGPPAWFSVDLTLRHEPAGSGENGTWCWTGGVRPDLGSATSVLEFWLGNNSEPRLKL